MCASDWFLRLVRARRAPLLLELALLAALACGALAACPEAFANRTRPAPAPVRPHGPGFKSQDRLEEHFRKHGAEFGRITLQDYLARAQQLRDVPAGGDVLELRRGDGVVCRFDRASGAFLAFESDGVIRTFFKPRDGENYFRRQAYRRHD
jgi:pyocin large subunit-like protein